MAADASIRVSTKYDGSDLKKLQDDFDTLTQKLEDQKHILRELEKGGYRNTQVWRETVEEIKATESELNTVKSAMKKSADAAKAVSDQWKRLAEKAMKFVAGIFVFQQITKVFHSMVTAIEEGFKNITQASTEYNQAMSNLKSSSAQMKNALASAFEPIVTAIIPYLVKLVDWITVAADKMAQFMAVISGRNYYNRAKKQAIDYAKTLNTAGKAAKGALASFDQLNVLSKNDGGGSAGGELTGADAFERVDISKENMEKFQKLKDILMEILGIATVIGTVFAGWNLLKLMTSIGPLDMWLGLIAGAALAVYELFDMWQNGVSWDGIIGYIGGVALAVLAIMALFGPLAAGIALIVSGAAGMIVALKDIRQNGLNAKNGLLLLISAVGVLAGVFIAFGGPATLVIGLIMLVVGAVAALVIAGGNGEEALGHLKDAFRSLGEFVSKIFTGDFKGALESLKECGRSFGNFFISVAEGIANGFVRMVNAVIDAINNMLPDEIPDWVPLIGGKSFPKIPNWNAHADLPRLAEGAVIPGGRPFAAILGDQRAGQTNIETPLSTMVSAFKQAMAETGGGSGSYTFVAELDGREIFRETVRQDQMYKETHGGNSAFDN